MSVVGVGVAPVAWAEVLLHVPGTDGTLSTHVLSRSLTPPGGTTPALRAAAGVPALDALPAGLQARTTLLPGPRDCLLVRVCRAACA